MKLLVGAVIAAGVLILAVFLLTMRIPAGSAVVLESSNPSGPVRVLAPGWHRRPFGERAVVYDALETHVAGEAKLEGEETPSLRYTLEISVDPARLPDLHPAMKGDLEGYVKNRATAMLTTLAASVPPGSVFSDAFRVQAAEAANNAFQREGFATARMTVEPLDVDALVSAVRALAPDPAVSTLRAPVTQALEADARSWPLLTALGMINESERLIAEAEASYLDALAIDPGALPPMERLLTIYTTVGEWPKLQRVLDAALTVNPDSVPHLNWTGLVLMKRRDFVGAERALSHALTLSPQNTTIMENMGALLMNTGRTEEAIGMFRRATEIAPGEPRALVNLGSALAASNRFQEALEPLERAEAAGSLSQNLANTLAIVHEKLGHAEKASEYRAKAEALKQQERGNAAAVPAASPPA